MGVVKLDVQKAEREYYSFLISDLEIVKWMLMYRDMYDVTYSSLEFDTHANDGWNAGDLPNLNQELLAMYVDLERLIEMCKFNKSQLALIELLGQGFNFEEIAERANISSQGVTKNFENICQAIVDMNEEIWKIHVHRSILNTPTKKCVGECERELPALESYFGKDKRRPDGLKSKCKTCYSKHVRDKRKGENNNEK